MSKNEQSAKLKALELTLGKLEKSYGKGVVMKLGDRVVEDIEAIPTGSIGLDLALGIGGYPRGRVVEIYGPESSGKTTLTIHAIAEVQNQGGIAAFIDAEHAFDSVYAKSLGVGFALIDKRRPKANKTEVVNLVGDLKDKHVMIIDDMIDTAGTICNAAQSAMDNGAIDVTCIATHPILSGPAVQRLSEAPINKIIVCDTLVVSEEKKFEKLEIVSVAKVFGESIGRIDSGQSLSSMFHF